MATFDAKPLPRSGPPTLKLSIVGKIQRPQRPQSATMTEQNPPAGWYPSPHDPAHSDRYWNGLEWGQQVREAKEPGLTAQLRTLPIWVMLLVPAFVVTAALASHAEFSYGPIRTDRLAVKVFRKYELRRGATEPLHLVKCKPGQEAFSCTATEYMAKKVAQEKDLTAIIAPSGTVRPVVLAIDPGRRLARPGLRPDRDPG